MSANQLVHTVSPLKTPIGNLLSNLDEATLQKVLEQPYMKSPLVLAVNPHMKIIQETLMKYAYFNTELGCFVRTKFTWGANRLGPMGYISEGYRKISVKNQDFKQSHLICLWFIGRLPMTGEQMDHIDGDTTNDRPSNLRLVSNKINSRNQKKRCTNSSGYTGVSLHSGRYCAYIDINGKHIYLGRFDSPEEAYAARQAYINARPELGFTARHGT